MLLCCLCCVVVWCKGKEPKQVDESMVEKAWVFRASHKKKKERKKERKKQAEQAEQGQGANPKVGELVACDLQKLFPLDVCFQDILKHLARNFFHACKKE